MRTSLVLACLLAGGCSAVDRPLPPGFLLGVATAGFQNDPGCPSLPSELCIDRHSDWYDFVTSEEIRADAGAYVRGDPLEAGPGSYELYPLDFDLVARQLRGNAVRLSLEWSRLFPQPTDEAEGYEAMRQRADPRALRHYHDVFAALRHRGLRPLVTLHHYTLPSWIHDAVGCHRDLDRCRRRGWLDRARIVREIAKYAAFCGREFGAEVDLWATLNEPFAVVLPGFLFPSWERSNPPAVALRFDEARTAMVAMLEAHARMYEAVHQSDTIDSDGDGQAARVGLVYNLTPAAPRDPDRPLDVQAAKRLFYLYNEVFLNAVIRGDLDEDMDGTSVHREDLGGRLDYLGLNYYTQVIVDGTETPALPRLSPLTTFNPLTLTLWTDHPRGLYDMALLVHSWGLPVLVTENGTADQSDESVAPRFLVRHLDWLLRAYEAGARIEGYFYWTLVDNYEWNHGMSMRFGLYRLEQGPDKRRSPREAARVFSEIGAAFALPASLRQRYGGN
ncbi:MAG: family 1 glycosylhydrolase [Myxococcales bacterium]|nr:family 1 glycosylhydrolase [Myxococcota bacterium]MDW8282472.1 family 1 glycosylhydrolase [Myxococcales bacterium]